MGTVSLFAMGFYYYIRMFDEERLNKDTPGYDNLIHYLHSDTIEFQLGGKTYRAHACSDYGNYCRFCEGEVWLKGEELDKFNEHYNDVLTGCLIVDLSLKK